MATSKPTEPRLVVQNIISTALQLLQYGRLMLVLFVLGCVIENSKQKFRESRWPGSRVQQLFTVY